MGRAGFEPAIKRTQAFYHSCNFVAIYASIIALVGNGTSLSICLD
jgi:hypothetical protein